MYDLVGIQTPLGASLIHQIWTLPSSLMSLCGQLPTTKKTVRIRVLPGCWGKGGLGCFRCCGCQIRGWGMQGGNSGRVGICKHM